MEVSVDNEKVVLKCAGREDDIVISVMFCCVVIATVLLPSFMVTIIYLHSEMYETIALRNYEWLSA
jgi:hypothetical protein